MTTFLFWNINKKPLERVVVKLALEHQVDVLMLVENSSSTGVILELLNEKEVRYHLTFSVLENIVLFTRFPRTFLDVLEEARGLSIRRLRLPGQTEIFVAVVHFPSKLQWSDASQQFECGVLASKIKDLEQREGHDRTVLVGDLNMNPFESGMVAAAGMHAVMTRETASKGSRIVRGNSYPFFYNPMWGKFGDGSEGPAGTYYDSRSEQATFFWNMFDQVMLRPSLMSCFQNEELKILTSDGDTSLLSPRGIPDRSVGSDHLPILFKLNLYEKETQHV